MARTFKPYKKQVALVATIIVITSAMGVVNPILIKVIFDTALFVPGGPKLARLYFLVGADGGLIPIVSGAFGIAQTYLANHDRPAGHAGLPQRALQPPPAHVPAVLHQHPDG